MNRKFVVYFRIYFYIGKFELNVILFEFGLNLLLAVCRYQANCYEQKYHDCIIGTLMNNYPNTRDDGTMNI